MYLGARLCKTRLHNGVWVWVMKPVKYIKETVRNCTVHLAANYGGQFKLIKKAENSFKMGYDPELDTSQVLEPDAASYYLTASVIRWMIELGRIDIITKALILSSHVALLRKGHFNAAVYNMTYVGQRYNSDWCMILHTQK